jgi:hypothetical protein
VIPGNSNATLVFDTTNWQLIYAVGVRTSNLYAVALDRDGNLTMAGAGNGAIPASPGAYSLSGSEFVATLDPSGRHSLAATAFDLPIDSLVNGAAVTPTTVYVPLGSFGAAPFMMYPPFPVIANPPVPGKCATLFAVPKVVQQCGNASTPQTTLYWDACDPQLDVAEVHIGSWDGPLLWRSTSGALSLNQSNTTYFLQDRKGHTLATEEVAYELAPRCSALSNPLEQLTAIPNPVLSCAENPLTGTQTTLSNGVNPPAGKLVSPVEIHVAAPAGQKLAYSPGPFIAATTGDWVRDGTAFFLTGTDLTPLAMERVFLLPIRSCLASPPTPPPAIQAKPATIAACGANSTLVWYSAGIHPVEIRESTATGRTVARFDQASGLFDLSPSATTTYHLVGYTDGAWKDLAADTVTLSAPGCSGPIGAKPQPSF